MRRDHRELKAVAAEAGTAAAEGAKVTSGTLTRARLRAGPHNPDSHPNSDILCNHISRLSLNLESIDVPKQPAKIVR